MGCEHVDYQDQDEYEGLDGKLLSHPLASAAA